MKKYQDALERISAVRRGQEKNQILWEVMKDPEVREALRVAIDPNLQTSPKSSHLKGIGVVTLNKAHAGLAKNLHIASPAAAFGEIDPKLWQAVSPVEKWRMIPFPPGARSLLGADGVVRGLRGFIAKLDRGYDKILEGALILPGVRTALEYYDKIKLGNVEGAKFLAYDVVDEVSPFLDRRKYLESIGVETLPAVAIENASAVFATWRLAGYNGAIFRQIEQPYLVGIDRALVICQFVQLIKSSLNELRARRKK